MATNYLDSVKEDIIVQIMERPLTIKDLQELLNLPYTTVQQAHKTLREEGRIVPFDRKSRGARWTLGANNGPKSVIPYVRLGTESYKMTDFTNPEVFVKNLSEAATTFFRAWHTIAINAHRLEKGIPHTPINRQLTVRKAELLTMRTRIENFLHLLNQFIDEDKFWDVGYLAQYPEDVDWDNFIAAMINLNDYFFEE